MQSFLVVSRDNTVEALKAAIDAVSPLPGGDGITDDGGVATFVDSGEIIQFDAAALARIWPAEGPAPYAWFVAAEDDDGVYTVYHGGPVGTRPVEIDQRLLIDGVLHRVGVVQVPGDRPDMPSWRVGLNRSDALIDARGRVVEIPSPAKVRVVRASPRAETAQLGDTVSRNMASRIPVKTGPTWGSLTVRELLRGIFSEADTSTRYVALRVEASGTPPATFTASEIEAGASLEGLSTGLAFPDLPDPFPSGMGVRIGVAVPEGDLFEYFSVARFPFGDNRRSQFFAADPTDTIELSDGRVDVYVSFTIYAHLLFLDTYRAYFDPESVSP